MQLSQRSYLVGALQNLVHADISQVALDRVVLQVACTREQREETQGNERDVSDAHGPPTESDMPSAQALTVSSKHLQRLVADVESHICGEALIDRSSTMEEG